MPHRDKAPLGAPCWIDLFTSDPDGAKAFYGQLFGWTSESAGEEYGGYITFAKDGAVVAGGMRSDGTQGPDAWTVYFATADAQQTVEAAATAVDAALARVAELGGSIVDPAEDTPYGRLATVADTTGTRFRVMGPNAA